jgi:hypothetical protein
MVGGVLFLQLLCFRATQASVEFKQICTGTSCEKSRPEGTCASLDLLFSIACERSLGFIVSKRILPLGKALSARLGAFRGRPRCTKLSTSCCYLHILPTASWLLAHVVWLLLILPVLGRQALGRLFIGLGL